MLHGGIVPVLFLQFFEGSEFVLSIFRKSEG